MSHIAWSDALLVRKGLELSRTQATAFITLGCASELDAKTLILKMPYTFVSGHREINLKLTGKLPAG